MLYEVDTLTLRVPKQVDEITATALQVKRVRMPDDDKLYLTYSAISGDNPPQIRFLTKPHAIALIAKNVSGRKREVHDASEEWENY